MCHFPITIKNPKKCVITRDEAYITVPCGKCTKCLAKRADHWLLRLQYELKTASSAHFVTLTYDDAPRTYNGLKTCKKDDLQNYFKRLRKREKGNTRIKYYAASEYGEKTHRPHYHIILFNVNDEHNARRAWSVDDKYIGIVHIGRVEEASMRYVTGYIEKKVGIGTVDFDDRLPEFSVMSQNLGIHYTRIARLFHSTTLQGYTTLGKRKFSLPRYYKNKMFPDTVETKVLQCKDTNGNTIPIYMQTKTINPIKKQISKLNYEKFIHSELQKQKDFNSYLAFAYNSECLAERDNPQLYKSFTTTKKLKNGYHQKSIL